MVKRSIDQKLRLRNFDVRNDKNWDRSSGYELQGIGWHWKRKRNLLSVDSKRSVFERSFRHESHDCAKRTPKAAPSTEPPTPRGWSASRQKSLWGAGVCVGRPIDSRAKTSWKVLVLNYLVTIGILPNVNFFIRNEMSTRQNKCSFPQWKVEEQPNKRLKKGGDESAVAVVKSVRQLGCVSQDAEPPESVTISRNVPKVLGPTQRVRFTRAALRQANIRDNQGPSLNKMQVKSAHQRSPYAVKFEDRSQEETERQERCAAETRGDLPRIFISSKKKEKAAFFSLSDGWFLLAHPQESRRKEILWLIPEEACIWSAGETFNSAELETMRTSRSPTTVMTANGEVLTKEEATVYVRELDLFVTVMLLEDTPAVPSHGKLCEDHGHHYHWTSGQKPHLIKNDRKIDCNSANNVPFVVPGLPTSSSSSSSPTFPTIFFASSTRSESMSEEVQGKLTHGQAETENPNIKMTTTRKYKETCPMICPNGDRSSGTVW